MPEPASEGHGRLPHRGGAIEGVDPGSVVPTLPKGAGRGLLDDLLGPAEHAEFVRSMADDPDLGTT